MKSPLSGKIACCPLSVERRNFFGASGAAIGLALLPSWATLAATYSVPVASGSLQVRLACLRDDGSFADVGGAATKASGKSVPGTMLAYGSSVDMPFGLEAQYGSDFHHRFWQARLQGQSMEISPPIRLRWPDATGTGQIVTVTSRGARAQIKIPARAGTYALTLSNTNSAPPSLAGYTIAGASTSGSGCNAALTERGTNIPASFAYAVFGVIAQAG